MPQQIYNTYMHCVYRVPQSLVVLLSAPLPAMSPIVPHVIILLAVHPITDCLAVGRTIGGHPAFVWPVTSQLDTNAPSPGIPSPVVLLSAVLLPIGLRTITDLPVVSCLAASCDVSCHDAVLFIGGYLIANVILLPCLTGSRKSDKVTPQ